MNDNKKRNDKKNSDQIRMIIFVVVITLILTAFVNRCITRFNKGTETEISYDRFVTMLEDKEIKSVTIEDDRYVVVPKNQENPLVKTTYTVTKVTDWKIVDRLKDSGAAARATAGSARPTIWTD